MKTSKKQTKSTFFRHLRLCLCLCVALVLIFALPISASEQENEFIVENHNLIEEYLEEIGKTVSAYTQSDTESGKQISEKVVTLINTYRKALIDLETHPDVKKRSMRAEIDLAFERCTSAGRVAWIYYVGISKLDDPSSVKAIDTVYADCIAKIDAVPSASILRATTDELCADLNSAIFSERLSLLGRAQDSSKCVGYIEEAKEALKNIRDPAADAPLLCALYDSTEQKLALQRARDKLEADMRSIFLILRPEEDIGSNKKIALFLLRLDNAQSLTAINEAAQSAVADILPPSLGIYTERLSNTAKASVSQEMLKANESGSALSLTHLFDGYTSKYKKACAKDEIAAALLSPDGAPELEALEQSFNSEGGIIDNCTSSEQIDAEIRRAKYKKAIYLSLKSALDELSVIMGPHDPEERKKMLTSAHESVQKDIDALLSTSNNFDENCNNLIANANDKFAEILNGGKAQRFLLDNKSIIVKPTTEIDQTDENALKIAITSFIKLEPSVRKLLSEQIKSIAEKYKSSLSDKISRKMEFDLFYKELSIFITNEIKNIPISDIEIFYNNCNRSAEKSTTLAQIVIAYRSVCSSAHYADYLQSEITALSEVCKQGAKELSKVDVSDALEYENRLNLVLKNTTISLSRTDACASVRICARNSKNVDIQKLVNDTCLLIGASKDKNEIEKLAKLATFKIERLLTADEIIRAAEELKYKLEKMNFIPAEQISIFCQRAEIAKQSFANKALLCENLAVLTFIWDSFCEERAAIDSEAIKKDLEGSKTHFLALLSKEISSLEDSLSAMAHLTEERKSELISSMASASAKFNASLNGCESSDAVLSLYTSTLEYLKSLGVRANAEDLSNYKEILTAQMDSLAPPRENYSEKSYKEILKAIEGAKTALKTCSRISECNEALETLKKDISKIGDILDDAKRDAAKELDNALRKVTDSASLYSSENTALAKSIYDDALKAIYAFGNISDTDLLFKSLSQSLELLRAIPKDVLFSSGAEGLLASGAEYPIGHSFSSFGYWGRIYSKSGIAPDASLFIREITLGEDAEDIRDLVRKASRRGSLKVYGSADEQRMELMKKCMPVMGLDITLSSLSGEASGYSLQMLLPSSFSTEKVLGLVFIDKNGEVEYYPTQQRGMLISLELSHLSRYYIVCENTVDLTPLLIFLIILLVFEIVAFCFMLFLRRNRKRKEKGMLPENFLYGFSPIFMGGALKITPSNGVAIALVLSVAALALGCAVAFVAKTEISALKRNGASQNTRNREKNIKREPETLPEHEKYALHEAESIPILCGAPTDNEEDIEAFILTDKAFDRLEETPNEDEDKKGAHRAEVNLDVIARKFKVGELVTPELLKKKHLISAKCDHVKILARGTLTKPLIIEAHDFSHAAEEMLKAVGGEAIRI